MAIYGSQATTGGSISMVGENVAVVTKISIPSDKNFTVDSISSYCGILNATPGAPYKFCIWNSDDTLKKVIGTATITSVPYTWTTVNATATKPVLTAGNDYFIGAVCGTSSNYIMQYRTEDWVNITWHVYDGGNDYSSPQTLDRTANSGRIYSIYVTGTEETVSTGYGNKVFGVETADIAKVYGVETSNIEKVFGS